MTRRYQIEGSMVSNLLEKLNKNNIQYIDGLCSSKSPYRTSGMALELEIQNKLDIPKFLEIVATEQAQNQIRIYSLEEGFPRPIIFTNNQIPNIQTTFLFKQLHQSEHFVQLDQDICDCNFLETFGLTKNEYGNMEGYYRSSAYIPGSDQLTCTDTGVFTIECIEEENSYTLETVAKNVRFYLGNIYPTPYDILFQIPDTNGISEVHIIEHYIHVFDNIVIHYADDLDLVEVYELDNMQMNLIPSKILSTKAEPINEQEKIILSIVSELKQKKEEQKRKRKREKED